MRRAAGFAGSARILSAFVVRDATIAWSYRLAFAMSLLPVVTGVGFVYFLGHMIGRTGELARHGVHGGYFGYAIVGTTLLSLFSISLAVFAQRLRSDQTTGTLEVLFTMPVPAWLNALGSAAYQILLSLGAGIVTVLVAWGLGMRFDTSPLSAVLALATVVVAVTLFCGAGIAFASFVIVFKRGEVVAALGTSALMVVGGVYYPVSLMPALLRFLAAVNPFTWALDILRSTLLASGLPLARFGLLCAATAVVGAAALRAFSRALDRSRRSGTLHQY